MINIDKHLRQSYLYEEMMSHIKRELAKRDYFILENDDYPELLFELRKISDNKVVICQSVIESEFMRYVIEVLLKSDKE